MLIEYVHPNYDYMGYCTHLLYTNENSLQSHYVGALAEDRLIYVNLDDNSVHIVWLTPSFLFLNAPQLQQSQTIVVVAYDNDTTQGVSASAKVNIQSNYIGDVSMDSHFVWPDIDVLENSYY